MNLPSRRRIKKELNRRLLYYPLLRMLLFKVWFRVAFLICLLIGLIAALYLPKVWKSSPDNFLPVVKVSALDMTQAWSLKRSAREAERKGDFSNANLSWQTAIANNPADVEAVRGFLNNVQRMDKPEKRVLSIGVGQTMWLLRLSKTNMADVELAAKMYDKFRLYDVAVYIFEPISDRLPAPAQATYLKALFNQGRFSQFGQEIAKLDLQKINDPELPLYKRAYLAGWGEGTESTESLNTLREERNKRETKTLANRLYLQVSAKRGDVLGYGTSLEELERWNEALVADHTGYWKALAASGQVEKAKELALAFTRSPASPVEAVKLAEVYHILSLNDQALEVLQRFAPQFAYSPDIWLSYASMLEDAQDWQELRAVALQIRKLDDAKDTLKAYSYFLEGRSELGVGRVGTALAPFKKAAEGQYAYPGLALLVGKELLKFNYPILAKQVLLPVEDALKAREDYWETAFNNAFKLKDSEWLLKAATEIHKFKPGDPAVLNQYVASLLVNRARPEESVKHTLQLISHYPNSLAAVVNHSLALLQNHRTSEAEEVLARVNAQALSSTESAAYYLALFELQLQKGLSKEAAETANKIDRAQLFPGQAEWVEEKVRTLPGQEEKAKNV